MAYKLFTDGGSRGNPGNAACAYYLFEDDKLLDFGGKFLGQVTNNIAEYSGLLLGLKAVEKLGLREVECNLDSELVVKQLNGEYKVSSPDMKAHVSKVMDSKKNFDSLTFNHVRREYNKFADKLVNIILDNVST